MTRPLVRLFACVTLLASANTSSAHAQLVPVRTVPVASGDQFLLLPSATLGMAGVRVAIDDSLADPWVNPAKGTFVRESAFLGSPTFYSISDRGGAGRSLPLAGTLSTGDWHGGLALALQQVENEPPGGFRAEPVIDFWEPPRRLSDAFARNLYGTAFVGRRLGPRWSVGIGATAADLSAMDGVDLLYAGADRIDQRGSTQDVRVGFRRTGSVHRVSLLLLHSRVSMVHDVTYTEWAWDSDRMVSLFETREERNEDKTRTWGAQLEWDRDVNAAGWRIGASATVNRKSHPKIPNYEIQNIPRDPGTSWAYEAAFGFARSAGPTTVGVDVAFQPIWSETWQEADAEDVTASGGRLSVGDRSIENDFFFTNVLLRAGVSHLVGRARLQTGLEARSYDYTLEQVNHVVRENREQDESWIEWSPTLGVAFRVSGMDLQYALRHTTGTGRPGTASDPIGIAVVAEQADGDFVLAPEGPLTLQEATVLTHQLTVRIPVR